MANLVKKNSRVPVVSRVQTIASGVLMSWLLAGCVDPGQQYTETPWEDRIWSGDSDGGSASTATVKSDAGQKADTAPAQSDTGDRADTGAATEPPQKSTPPSEPQASTISGESPKSPEAIVQDTAPAVGPPTVAAAAPVPPIAPVTPPVPEKPAIDDDPERLMGLGAGQLTLMLGTPRFVRRDASAQLWRYRNKSCILDLFLYRDAGRPEYFVNHIEARRAEGGAALKRKCFGALLLEQLDREAG